jgi:hypothetical protein
MSNSGSRRKPITSAAAVLSIALGLILTVAINPTDPSILDRDGSPKVVVANSPVHTLAVSAIEQIESIACGTSNNRIADKSLRITCHYCTIVVPNCTISGVDYEYGYHSS